ncbi:PREDICTED: uncharacterized protein LOC109172516 [Ipomoea nil]|uniref:uncharacterized protein LOC109172516 n=1 Tax=Ipomoea nil TaxID=35883 RepID=UPI000901DB81|nr:PREDICTED: uncharacterized protein LOC109172516 [Ipomoea nil]
MGNSSIRGWCKDVLLPKDVESTKGLADGFIIEALLRQSYRDLTLQMELGNRFLGFRNDMRALTDKLHQTEEALREEQAKQLRMVEVHNAELLRVTRQWEDERDKAATIAVTSVEDYKKSAAFEADVQAAVEARSKEVAKAWLATPEGDDFLLDLGERDYRLGFREAQTEIYTTLLARDSSFTPEGWGLKPVLDAEGPAALTAPATLPVATPPALTESSPQAEDPSSVPPTGQSVGAQVEGVAVDTPSPIA